MTTKYINNSLLIYIQQLMNNQREEFIKWLAECPVRCRRQADWNDWYEAASDEDLITYTFHIPKDHETKKN